MQDANRNFQEAMHRNHRMHHPATTAYAPMEASSMPSILTFITFDLRLIFSRLALTISFVLALISSSDFFVSAYESSFSGPVEVFDDSAGG
jgi:hypothetical protein